MRKIIAFIVALAVLAAVPALAEQKYLGLTEFTTTDTDGNTVTQDIFADYDLTMVNVWATWCGYCIQEMPEFNGLKERLPENMNIITICTDAVQEPELTAEILNSIDANFQTLLVSPEIEEQLLVYVSAFPTTFFLDKSGYAVVEPLMGVPSRENAGDAYYDYMMAILDALKEIGYVQ